MTDTKTVAIIGAGPVGLAAAAHVLERGLKPIVLEAGSSAGHAVHRSHEAARCICVAGAGFSGVGHAMEILTPEPRISS